MDVTCVIWHKYDVGAVLDILNSCGAYVMIIIVEGLNM